MTKYVATFSNGQSFVRKSNRAYAFAWSYPVDRPNYKGFCSPGFSATHELAEKAMAQCLRNADNVGPGEIVSVEVQP